MKTEQIEKLLWQWNLTRVPESGRLDAWRGYASSDTHLVAAGSYEAVQAAKRLLSGQAVRP